MFTGIIEEVGTIGGIRKGANSIILTVKGNRIFSDLQIGDSVAVNGVCLTATKISGYTFQADVMPETMTMTNFGLLQIGSPVNLERAMPANGRFGGHMVAGHVDGKGKIQSIEKNDNAFIFTIGASSQLMEYIIYKGSIAIDGASLTVMKRDDHSFSVSIIPHTISQTILAHAQVGTQVNLETDIAGRYIRHFLTLPRDEETTPLSNDFKNILIENGFI